MSMDRKTDITKAQPMPTDGVDVKNTKQLTGLADNPKGLGESNKTEPYVTGGKCPVKGDI